jgi:hypothetical protein
MIGETGAVAGIGLDEYFSKPHTLAQRLAVDELLEQVHALAAEAINAGAFQWVRDPDTGCCISGSRGGDGDGGMRTPSSSTGAPDSAHRVLPADKPKGAAVDVADPGDRLDTWLDTFEDGRGGNSMLEKHGLYREAANATKSWCHLTTRAPASGHRTFQP